MHLTTISPLGMMLAVAMFTACQSVPENPPPATCACPAGAPVAMVGEVKVETGPELKGCAREVFRLHSAAMNRDIDVGVLLPPAYAVETGRQFPVLYAFHGYGAPFLCWTDMGPLRQALAEKPMLLVVFNGDKGGWYVDATQRPRSLFTNFFFNELVPYIERTYRADPTRRGATGFSMGGCGSFHYLLARPGFFCGVSALSSGLEMSRPWGKQGKTPLDPLLGPRAENEAEYHKVAFYERFEAAVKDGIKLPPFFLACGTEDKGLPGVRKARDFLVKLGVPCEYQEAPGEHKWQYWNATSGEVADFHWRTFQPWYAPKNLYTPPPEPAVAPTAK